MMAPYMLSPDEVETLQNYDKLGIKWKERGMVDHWKDQLWYAWRSYIPRGGRVLDIGCGVAQDALLVIDDGLYYIGIDLSRGMLAVGREDLAEQVADGAVELLHMNMCEMTFPPDSFDGFRAVTTFMQVPRKNLPVALAEAHRVLKSQGSGFISVPYGANDGMWQPPGVEGHFLSICYDDVEFAHTLTDAGFYILHIEVYSSMILCIVQKP